MSMTVQDGRPRGVRRRQPGLRAAIGALGATAALMLTAGGTAAAAPLSSGIDRDSRITVLTESDGVAASASHGDVVYLAGQIYGVGLRAPGLAVFDEDGELEPTFPELDGSDAITPATARRVVPDGAGGAYVVGTSGRGAEGIRRRTLLHVTASGELDLAFRPSFQTAAGAVSTDVRDAALGADGTLYVAGGFERVGGEPRDGLAAIDAATGAVRAWDPQLEGVGPATPSVDRIAVAGDQVLIAGAFARAGGQSRDGLAGIAVTGGGATAWSPPGLTNADAAAGLLVGGGTAYVVSATAIRSITTAAAGTVTDLNVAPSGGDIAAAALTDGRLYVTGTFTQLAGATREGLAEIDASDGSLEAWNPGQAGATPGTAIAVDADRVYVGVPIDPFGPAPWGGITRCGLGAVSRSTGAVQESWRGSTATGPASCVTPPDSIVAAGGRLWAAGGFTVANVQPRTGLAAIDVAADEILPWAPRGGVNARANALAVSPDGETVYGVGNMTSINGTARRGAWALAATGAADDASALRPWDPNVTGVVRALELIPTEDGQGVREVLLGGAFTRIGGDTAYARLAAVGADGLPVASWRPAPDGAVNDIEIGADGTVYAAGAFNSIGSTPAARRYLAALPAGSDDVAPGWDAQVAPEVTGSVFDLAVAGDVIYAAGSFDGVIGGQPRRGVVALQRTSGAVAAWNPAPNGGAVAVSVAADGLVYLIAGDPNIELAPFTRLGDTPRPARVAAVNADGSVHAWSPQSPSYVPARFKWAMDPIEVAGKLLLIGSYEGNAFDGVPQNGLFAFGAAVAPSVVEPPTLSGVAREGEQLTCEPGTYGLQPVALAYAWLRDGSPIAGADGTTYLLQAEDRGTDISCRETAENAAGRATATSAPLRVTVQRPGNVEAPEVAGTDVRVGVQATCARGRWTDFPTGYQYRWLLDGAPIAGATEPRYTPTAGQENRQLACGVIAVNAAGSSDEKVSAARQIAPGEDRRCTVDCEPPPPPCTVNCEPPPPPPPPCTVNCGPPPARDPPPPPVRDPPSSRFPIPSGRATASRLTFALDLPGAGALKVAATARVGRRTIQVGSSSVAVRGAGRVTVNLRLSAAARRALARARGRGLRVSVRFTYTPSGGRATTVTRAITVRAARRAARRRGASRGRARR